MLNFPKLFGKKQDSELVEKDIVEVNPADQNEQVSEEQSYDLPSTKEGEVALEFTGVSPVNGALLVGFFVSNGLSQNVKFENVPLVLIDADKRVLARQSFDGETIGEVVGGSAKACVVRFLPDNVYTQDIPVECQVCFDIPNERPQSNEIQYQSLPEDTTETQHQELERILRELPPMKHGEVNVSPLNAQITTQGDLLTTVIIRNFTDKTINLEQMPLVVLDARQEELARGLFDIKDLSIEPLKAMLWTFNFGTLQQDRDIDLSSWHINVVQ